MSRFLLTLFVLISVGVFGCHHENVEENMVRSSAERMQTVLNPAGCQSLYEAAEISNRSDQLHKSWTARCGAMFKHLGQLKTSKNTAAIKLSSHGSYLVRSFVQFQNETCWMESWWHVEHGKATLYLLWLADPRYELYLPEAPHPPGPIKMDPPSEGADTRA